MPALLPAPADLYAASCNPPRRAKRARSSSDPRAAPLSPGPGPAPKHAPVRADTPAEPPASIPKRGRKPGAMSRAAREAQRKLNHSIIEKARRTKINEALATLRRLVPDDYGCRPADGSDADDDDDDDDYKGAKKPKGKRQEKEKEFKLEILIRTVSFMQELLDRVAVLEKGECLSCGGPGTGKASKKRKRASADDSTAEDAHMEQSPMRAAHQDADDAPRPTSIHPRLPSIASWLPERNLLPSPSAAPAQLPSPPNSTKFRPTPTTHLPPALALDIPAAPAASASASAAHVPASPRYPARTPEDESAASLLLQISASPQLQFSASPSMSMPSPRVFFAPAHGAPSALDIGTPRMMGAGDRDARAGRFKAAAAVLQAQTPSSLLGMQKS